MCNYVEQDAYVAPTVDFLLLPSSISLQNSFLKNVKPLEIQAGIKTTLICNASVTSRKLDLSVYYPKPEF